MLKILISIQFILNLISRECRERKCIKMVKVSKLLNGVVLSKVKLDINFFFYPTPYEN